MGMRTSKLEEMSRDRKSVSRISQNPSRLELVNTMKGRN